MTVETRDYFTIIGARAEMIGEIAIPLSRRKLFFGQSEIFFVQEPSTINEKGNIL